MFKFPDLYNHAKASHSNYIVHSLHSGNQEFNIGNRCAWAVYLPQLLDIQPKWKELLNHLQVLWKEGPVFLGNLFNIWNVIYHYLDFREKRILVMFNKSFYMNFRSNNIQLGKAICSLSNSALRLTKVCLLMNCNKVRWDHLHSGIEYFLKFNANSIWKISKNLPLDVGIQYNSKYHSVSIRMVATEPRFRMASHKLNNVGFNMNTIPSVELFARTNGNDNGRAVGILRDEYYLCWSKLEGTWCLERDWKCELCTSSSKESIYSTHDGGCGVICLYFNLEEGFFDLNNIAQLSLMSNFGTVCCK